MNEAKWYLRTQDETFGPETEAKLVEWARLGRIQPGQEVSDDNVIWRRVEDVPFLDMRFSIDIGDGNPRGPFNKAAADALIASGRLPMTATIVEVRAPFADEGENRSRSEVEVEGGNGSRSEVEVEDSSRSEVEVDKGVKVVEKIVEVPVEKIVEKIVEVPVEKIVEVIKEVEKPVEIVKEVRVEVPVEKIVEKVVEVEKPVEVFKEVIKEVPVEKIVEKEVVKEVPVEVEKIVVDETRVKELESQRDELNAKIDALNAKAAELNGTISGLSGKLADAGARETKLMEQVQHLEDELRRLPQAASEVADIQAAMYTILTKETEELAGLIEAEKREFETFKARHQARLDRLTERRREMIRRSGSNIEDMTRKALMSRPEDPRTTQLRKELDALRHEHDLMRADDARRINELTERLRTSQAELARMSAGMKDVTQLRAEAEQLREQLQRREKDLVAERERNEEISRQQATRQQVLMSRLASLESPSIGTSQTMATNQSREAHQVKLPGWMRLGK